MLILKNQGFLILGSGGCFDGGAPGTLRRASAVIPCAYHSPKPLYG
jgi:hypothetical protein